MRLAGDPTKRGPPTGGLTPALCRRTETSPSDPDPPLKVLVLWNQKIKIGFYGTTNNLVLWNQMIRRKEVNECICWCGHTWLSESIPKRCAGKGKHRDWNSRDSKTVPIEQEVSRILSSSELDQFSCVEVLKNETQTEKPKPPGSSVAESILAQMALKLGRPKHSATCTCYICKPPKQ